MCRNYDTWKPLLDKAFYFWRPGSVSESDVNRTFAEWRVGNWVTVKDGRLYMWRHTKGFSYSERGPSMIAQIDRMVQRKWPLPDFHLLYETSDAPRFLLQWAANVKAPVGSMSATPGSYMDIPIPVSHKEACPAHARPPTHGSQGVGATFDARTTGMIGVLTLLTRHPGND